MTTEELLAIIIAARARQVALETPKPISCNDCEGYNYWLDFTSGKVDMCDGCRVYGALDDDGIKLNNAVIALADIVTQLTSVDDMPAGVKAFVKIIKGEV